MKNSQLNQAAVMTLQAAKEAAKQQATSQADTPHVEKNDWGTYITHEIKPGYLTETQVQSFFAYLSQRYCLPKNLATALAKRWTELERRHADNLVYQSYVGSDVTVIYYPANTIKAYLNWIFQSEGRGILYKNYCRLDDRKFRAPEDTKYLKELLACSEEDFEQIVRTWQWLQTVEKVELKRPY